MRIGARVLCSVLAVTACAGPTEIARSSTPAPTITVSSADRGPITQTPRTAAPTVVIDTVDCADVAAFLERTRPARLAAAGLTSSSVEPSPTPVPSNAEPPPLGQYVLRESPDDEFSVPAFVGFLQNAQDLGPLATGQTAALAVRTRLVWGYSRNWTGRVAGGFASTVYEFAGASGARDFEEGAAQGACLQGGSLFEVAGIPGAIGQRFNYGYPTYAARVTFLMGKRRYMVQIVSLFDVRLDRIAQEARIALSVAK
jgi:hypothetical protein